MSRQSPKSKSSKRGQHGDPIGHLPGDPNITLTGTGLTKGGPKSIKGPGTEASYKGKTKGMGGK